MEIEANSCFAIFGKNSKIQNGRHFWGGEIFFENGKEYIAEIPCGLKISPKWLYLARLRRYKEICVLPFLAKIQNGRHIWGGEIFLKIAKITFLMPLFHQKIKPRSCRRPLIVDSRWKNNKNGREYWVGTEVWD